MTNTGLILYDLLKGTHVRKTMRFLKDSRHWSREELENYQAEKLGRLVEKVQKEVPFYRSPDTGYRIPGDWPIVDRKMTMEAGDRLLSEKINLKKCKVSRTGGTTGPPMRLYRDTETRSWALAAYYRFYEWMGIEPGMPEAELWGTTEIRDQGSEIRNQNFIQNSIPQKQTLLHNGIFDRISRFRSYNAFSFNDTYLEAVVADMQKFKPRLIRGYLSAILLLADYIKKHHIKGINPVALSSTAETLFPGYRNKIETVFQAPLFNQYGCGECNSIAFECSQHKGMHITMEHCLLEQDAENNLILTNLDNYSQPFIRYKNGDKGIIDHSPCACGNVAPRLVEIQGRASENIILKDGSSVNGIFFANLLDETGFINSDHMLRFQVVQNKSGDINFRAEVKDAMSNADLQKLKDALMPFFRKVEISQHKFLDPGLGGKFRYIISNI